MVIYHCFIATLRKSDQLVAQMTVLVVYIRIGSGSWEGGDILQFLTLLKVPTCEHNVVKRMLMVMAMSGTCLT